MKSITCDTIQAILLCSMALFSFRDVSAADNALIFFVAGGASWSLACLPLFIKDQLAQIQKQRQA